MILLNISYVNDIPVYLPHRYRRIYTMNEITNAYFQTLFLNKTQTIQENNFTLHKFRYITIKNS